MPKITDHNHALRDVTRADINYIRISQYKAEVNTVAKGTTMPLKIRLNCSINFEATSPYQELHQSTGFLNLLFRPTLRLRDLVRPDSQHPEWQGFTDLKIWAKNPDNAVALTSKGAFVGKKGNRSAPRPAYYTALGLGFEDKNMSDPYISLRIGNYQTYIEMYEVENNKFFSHLGDHSEWH